MERARGRSVAAATVVAASRYFRHNPLKKAYRKLDNS
jgi:hypothetical protein